MGKFKLNMTPLEVCRVIVSDNPIEKITLVKHRVGLNWSQKYPTPKMKRRHLLEAYAVRPMEEYEFSREEFMRGEYEKVCNRLGGNDVLSVVSRVGTKEGNCMHIPLMNFHLEGGFGLREIKQVLAHACPKRRGALLKSGRFYHYYGDFLLGQREWEAFLGLFLIPVHLVHPSYIGHGLKYGYNTLRLTSGRNYKTEIPTVVETL